MTFRTDACLREQLEAAAAARGITASEEVTRRLHASFRDDDMRAAVREEIRAAFAERRVNERAADLTVAELIPPLDYNGLQANLRAGYGDAYSYPAGHHVSGIPAEPGPCQHGGALSGQRLQGTEGETFAVDEAGKLRRIA